MELNNILAFGSTVDVLLICNYETTIGAHTYKAGEPFTYLKSVQASIDAQVSAPQITTESPSTKGLRVVNQINYPYRLTLGGVNFTSKITDLFFGAEINTETVAVLPRIEHETIKLEHTPNKIYIYRNTPTGIELLGEDEYTVNDDWLTIHEINETDSLLGFYYYNDSNYHRFGSLNYPYFKAIIYGKGNVSGSSFNNCLVLEKVALMPTTGFDFAGSTQNNVTLVFGIIDAEKTVSIKLE